MQTAVNAVRAVALATAILALAGCAGGSPGAPPTTAPPSSAPPSTAPPTVVSAEPSSRYGLDCADLVDEALALATVTVPVAAVDPLVTAAGVGTAIPRRTSIISQGGTVCEWSNGVPVNDQYGSDPAYVGVVLSVLPRPASGWSAKATQYGMPSNVSSCAADLCVMSTVVGDAWVTLEASGGSAAVIDPVAADALLADLVATVTAAGAPTPLATPARTQPPLPSDCELVLPVASVRTITGDTGAVLSHGGGGWSDWAEARLNAANEGCRWAVGDENSATVGWIRDGRWAYDRAQAAGTFSPTTITGLGAGDEATIRCDAAFGTTCSVDIAFGPDWVNIAGNDEATAIELAEAVVARLTP